MKVYKGICKYMKVSSIYQKTLPLASLSRPISSPPLPSLSLTRSIAPLLSLLLSLFSTLSLTHSLPLPFPRPSCSLSPSLFSLRPLRALSEWR